MTRTISAFGAIIGIVFFMSAFMRDDIKYMIAFAFMAIMCAIVHGGERIISEIKKGRR